MIAEKNYSIEYEVKATNGGAIVKIQYKDKNAEWVRKNNPNIPLSISLIISVGNALETAAFGEIEIEAFWSPAIEGQSAESKRLENSKLGSVIQDVKVEIEDRSLPRYSSFIIFFTLCERFLIFPD